jgi:hypothetical protein
MDPYLEDATLWPGVHAGLIAALEGTLNHVLPEGYAADIGERVYLLDSRRDAYPDLAVAQIRRPGGASRGASASPTGEAAVLDPAAAPWIIRVAPREVRETFLEIRALREDQRLVTVIEVLSPSNKAAGSHGRRLYREKQDELLRSETHLVEIDLLRGGAHTVAAPLDYLVDRGAWDYLVCLHRGGQDEVYELWPIGLRQRLPRIQVPLGPDEADVALDLQPVLDRRYDEGRYAVKIDYRAAPVPPLSPADQEWAAALLGPEKAGRG